ncbi:DUF445 family protein [bacterium]|nr:DUF445 family protein [bacterium]
MEYIFTFFGIPADQGALLCLPVIGALIGWGTNLLAVKMLFHPKRPIGVRPFVLHGVFPKRQAELAKKLGTIVSEELFSVAEVSQHIQERAHSEKTVQLVSDQIEHVIRFKLPEVVPMVAMVLNDELVETVKKAFVGELQSFLGVVIDELSASLEEDLDVRVIVEEKVRNFSSDKLEEILFAVMRREFRFIELVGAVLGFFIGVGQIAFLLLV